MKYLMQVEVLIEAEDEQEAVAELARKLDVGEFEYTVRAVIEDTGSEVFVEVDYSYGVGDLTLTTRDMSLDEELEYYQHIINQGKEAGFSDEQVEEARKRLNNMMKEGS